MSRYKLSRKAFIRLALLSGIGAGLAVFQKLTAPIHPISYIRWKTRGLWLQKMGKPTLVALQSCPTYQDDIAGALKNLWTLAEMPDVQGKRILIKPNLVDSVDNTNATTAPEVVAALADLFTEMKAASIVVGDGPAFRRDAFSVARQSGLLSLLEPRDIPFVDLNYDDPQLTLVKDGWFQGQSHIWLPRHAVEADFIVSVPKMKTHHWAQITLSLKNLLGILPGARYGWPKNFIHFSGISQSILGVYRALPPVVAVVDGIVGMQGDGPLFGSPVQHGLLAAGIDLVAVDWVCKEIMGFDGWSVDYLNLASWAGIGQTSRIEIRGAAAKDFYRTYEKPPGL